MNSFKIFPEIIWTNIFTSLKGYELLEASLVAKDWYRMIGRSPICMKKLTIKFREDNNLESLLDSNRLYQNFIYYKFNHEITPEHLQAMSAIINKFSGSLTSIQTSHDVEVYSDFPKLKKLKFMDYEHHDRGITSAIVPNGLLTKANNLEELGVKFLYLDETSVNCLREFLMTNESLKILTLKDCSPMQGISSTAFKMRLERYSMTFDGSILLAHNFFLFNNREFFKAQTSSLKYVQCTLSYEIMHFFISNFPNLHTLAIDSTILDYKTFGTPFPDYPINTSIKSLLLNFGVYGTSNDTFKQHIIAILTNLENLEYFKICTISKDILNAIKCCKSLRIVEYRTLWSDVNIDDLKNVRKIKFVKKSLAKI